MKMNKFEAAVKRKRQVQECVSPDLIGDELVDAGHSARRQHGGHAPSVVVPSAEVHSIQDEEVLPIWAQRLQDRAPRELKVRLSALWPPVVMIGAIGGKQNQQPGGSAAHPASRRIGGIIQETHKGCRQDRCGTGFEELSAIEEMHRVLRAGHNASMRSHLMNHLLTTRAGQVQIDGLDL